MKLLKALTFGHRAVLAFWFNIDNWSNVRCNSKWEDSWSHWSERRKSFPSSFKFCLGLIWNFNLNNFVTLWFFFFLFFSFHFWFKQAMGFSEVFCIMGWLAVVFSKVSYIFLFLCSSFIWVIYLICLPHAWFLWRTTFFQIFFYLTCHLENRREH